MKMPEHTDTPKENSRVYTRRKAETLHRRQVCINDIASVCIVNIHAMRGQIKGIIVDKIRGKKSVISV